MEEEGVYDKNKTTQGKVLGCLFTGITVRSSLTPQRVYSSLRFSGYAYDPSYPG